MAHWAEIDESNLVVRVLVTDNDDPNGDEGYRWLIENLGGTWIKTSYNTYEGEHLLGGTPLRKNYAAVGYTYDEERDAFIAPQPDPIVIGSVSYEFVFDENKCSWVPTPVA
jgi:hypothetical protein